MKINCYCEAWFLSLIVFLLSCGFLWSVSLSRFCGLYLCHFLNHNHFLFCYFVLIWIFAAHIMCVHVRIRGGTGGSDPPLKNDKAIGFLSKTGPEPLKIHKATKPAFNAGQPLARQRNTIEAREKKRIWTPSDETFWIRAWCVERGYLVRFCKIVLCVFSSLQ